MGKIKLLGAVMCAGLSFAWAAPAMAQMEGGIEGPPDTGNFYTPQTYDAGIGCSRQRPKECTPEQREKYNDYVSTLCAVGGGITGTADGLLVAWLWGVTAVGAPAAPIAGAVHGAAVSAVVYQVCMDRYKIPSA